MILEKIYRSFRLQKLYRQLNPSLRSCPLCRQSNARLVASRDRNGLGLRTVECAHCGLIFTNPFLNEEDLNRFYGEMYRDGTKGQGDPSQFLSYRPWMADRARYFLDRFGQHIGQEHLDFGCGEGSFVASLHEQRPEVKIHLVEPDPNYRAFAASLCAGREWDSLAAIDDQDVMVDSISMIHVLEHVIDPVAVLTELRSILKLDGRLLIDVPDVARYSGLSDLHISHCTHFGVETLTMTLQAAGFEVVSIEQHEPPHLPKSLCVEAVAGGVVDNIHQVSERERLIARAGIKRANQTLLEYTLQRLMGR